MITWVIGANGLLGNAIHNEVSRSFLALPIRWNEPSLAIADLERNAREFQTVAAQPDGSIVWAAGKATTSSTLSETQRELHMFSAAMEIIREFHPSGRGCFFLSSSAGGVYAGSQHPPFSAISIPGPVSPYGNLKLDQEKSVSEILSGVCPIVLGRISNLYGPGQDLDKLQGLISRLALAAVTKQPVNMFVSLDTMRDYIYTKDAARVIHYWTRESLTTQPQGSLIRVIASGTAVSLGHLIHVMQDVARTRIPIALGAHASSSMQAKDLRLQPTGEMQIAKYLSTTLNEGSKNVFLDVLQRFQRATIQPPSES